MCGLFDQEGTLRQNLRQISATIGFHSVFFSISNFQMSATIGDNLTPKQTVCSFAIFIRTRGTQEHSDRICYHRWPALPCLTLPKSNTKTFPDNGFPLKYLSEDVIPYLCKSFTIYYSGHFLLLLGP